MQLRDNETLSYLGLAGFINTHDSEYFTFYRYSSTMDPHNKTVRKRESKLKPPKSYLSKSKPPPSWQRKTEETPDIVSSCDSKVKSSLERTEPMLFMFVLQRNSLELDSSLGILSPEDMKDFTLGSMTQSFASISSLPRDVSCEDLDSAADTTVTEDYHVEVMLLLASGRLHQTIIIIFIII